MGEVVRYERRGDVGLITIDSPPVNALGQPVRAGLIEALDHGLADDGAKALVLAAAGRTFPTGADISEFGKPLAPPHLREVIAAFEASSKPVVVAIHGNALGGGLELALGCDYRVALPSARVGLPEVKLGILPGAGGTQRLPRLVGVAKALELTTTGAFVSAPEAADLGILDTAIEGGDAAEAGLTFAQRVIDEGLPKRRVRDVDDRIAADRSNAALFDDFTDGLAGRARGLFSPFRIVEAVRAAVEMPFDDGMKRERELFDACMDSPQRRGLIHAFFAEREATKIADMPEGTPVREIRSAGVVGAGTMGGGIAMCFANAGIPVTVLEVSQDALDRGLEALRNTYARSVSGGRLSQDKMDQRVALIEGTLDYGAFAGADIVVEAVFEDMELKHRVFAELDRACKPGAILATNTSALDVNAIAAGTGRPEDVVGTHFFSPANVMRLLEVVRAEKASWETLAAVMRLGRTLGKVAVPVGVCDGFVGSRMYFQYGREAEFLLEEGALPEQVDRVLTEFGMAMGPLAVRDLAGVDLGAQIRERLIAELPEGYAMPSVLQKIAAAGRYGQKTGLGYYRYEEGSRTPTPDPEVTRMIEAVSAEKGIQRRDLDEAYILERCVYALINEGARILEEKIAQRSADIDIIYLNGYGFPSYRGGPMFYADEVGLDAVYERVKAFHAEHGPWWTPAPLLERLVRDGGRFTDL